MDLQLIYDGDALSNHEINPKELSVALLGIDALLHEANLTLNKNKAKIQVKVKASFETGCFKINFTVVQSVLDKAKELFSSVDATAITNALTIAGALYGLVGLLKFLRGLRPEKIHQNNDGTFTVWKSNKNLKVEESVIKLYKNYKLRQAFEQVVSPLEKEGVDDCAFKIGNKTEDYCQIKKEEALYFKVPSLKEIPLGGVTFDTSINIINLSFKGENKWYVNDGQSSFHVLVEDENFLRKIDESIEEFSKADILRVRLRREQFQLEETGKLKTEFFIEEVLEHRKPPNQTSLNF